MHVPDPVEDEEEECGEEEGGQPHCVCRPLTETTRSVVNYYLLL